MPTRALSLATVIGSDGALNLADVAGLHTVAGTGSYTDLINKPTIPSDALTFTGDASGSGTTGTTTSLTLANSGVSAGSYGSATNIPAITVDSKGRITSVTNTAVSIPSGSLTFTGDVTGSGSTGSSTSLTLASVGTAGTYTKVTTDAKGRVTSGTTLASGDLPIYTGTLTSSQITTALGFTPENISNKAVANGYASLDSTGKVPSAQLPSYVDDVLEYANLAAFPGTGSGGIIYVTQDTNKTYRWTGSVYVEISPSPGTTDSLTEGSTNLYYTNARARASLNFIAGSGAYNSTTGTITIPTNTTHLTNGSGYITGNQTVTLSGDASGSGATAITVTLASSGVTAGTYNNVTVDAKGRVTSGSNTSYLQLSGGTLTGNLTMSAAGLFLNRNASATHGISWYSSGYTAWSTYMAQASQASVGPTANITAPSGTVVTSWALRNFIENASGYGWTWESGTGTQTTPTVVAEIRASDGHARFGAVSNAGPLGTNSSNAKNHFTQFNSGSASAAAGWIAAAFGDTNATRVVIGQAQGYGYIGSHDANLTAWAPLHVGNDASTSTVMIGFAWGTAPDNTYRLKVNGAFAATTKSFLIDHPTKQGWKLRYGSLEGPENGVYVRGKLKGSNKIELPEYWTKLVDPDSISVTLTAIGKHQKLYIEDISNNVVTVANSGLFAGEINCFFVVYGERVDVDKLVVEYE